MLDHTPRGKKMVILDGVRIDEEEVSEDTDNTDIDIYNPHLSNPSKLMSAIPGVSSTVTPVYAPISDYALTRAPGKSRKTRKAAQPFYNGYGVLYLPVTLQSGTNWFMYQMHILD